MKNFSFSKKCKFSLLISQSGLNPPLKKKDREREKKGGRKEASKGKTKKKKERK
jgi:hypothetical protein